jgi:hypothetical protein
MIQFLYSSERMGKNIAPGKSTLSHVQTSNNAAALQKKYVTTYRKLMLGSIISFYRDGSCR